jgi:hypothetical protein
LNDFAWFHLLRRLAKLFEDRQKFCNQVTPNPRNDESQPKPGQILLKFNLAVDRNENVERALSVQKQFGVFAALPTHLGHSSDRVFWERRADARVDAFV